MKAKEYFTTKRITFMALFTALVAIATLLTNVPSLAGAGYLNAGDTMIFLCSAFFGPLFSFIVGGLGSAIAELFVAMAFYAPFTFLIKGLEGMAVAFIIKLLKKCDLPLAFTCFIAFVLGGLIMSGGYVVAETVLIGWTLATINFTYNMVQAAVNVVLGLALTIAFSKIRPINKLFNLDSKKTTNVNSGADSSTETITDIYADEEEKDDENSGD